jgi:hypothetical protein
VIGAIGVVAILVFVFQIFFAFYGLFSDSSSLVGNIIITSSSLLALISMIVLYVKFPSNFPKEKWGNFFMVVSVFLFFLGDLLWLIDEVIRGQMVPIGGFPDMLWNLAYFALITAMGFFISFSFRPSNKWLYMALAIGSLVALAVLYEDVSEDLELGTFTFSHSIQDTYILYDFIVLAMIVYFVWPMFSIGGGLATSWIILSFGLATRIVYDRVFAQMSEEATYYTGHPVDLLYVLFYLAIIFANLYKYKLLCKNNG